MENRLDDNVKRFKEVTVEVPNYLDWAIAIGKKYVED